VRIDNEHGDVDHLVKAAACRRQNLVQVARASAPAFQFRLGRSVGQAADLAGNEQEAIGTDGRRIAVALIQILAAGGKTTSRTVIMNSSLVITRL
jgi:hypothetical protein